MRFVKTERMILAARIQLRLKALAAKLDREPDFARWVKMMTRWTKLHDWRLEVLRGKRDRPCHVPTYLKYLGKRMRRFERMGHQIPDTFWTRMAFCMPATNR